MTRQEFIDGINYFYELIDFCGDNDCFMMEDVISADTLDDYVNEDVENHYGGWQDLRSKLADIPTGYDYYRVDGSFDYVGLDEQDFDEYKTSVLNWADENGAVFDEEEDEEGETEEGGDVFDASYFFRDPLTGELFDGGYEFQTVSNDEAARILF